MESAVPMLLFLGALMGFGFLIMYCLYQNSELERAEQEAAREKEQEIAAEPGFFAPSPPLAVADTTVDGARIRSFEQYVAEQQDLATRFVDAPTVENLLTRVGQDRPERVFEVIEAFLRAEERLVRDFLSNPTVERLHRRSKATAAA